MYEPVWRKWYDERVPVRVGVSACLLGAEVRFDGGHKRDPFLVEVLGPSVSWVPVCPELELGLGVPRPSLQLRTDERGLRLVARDDGHDWTDAMHRFADRRVRELDALGLDGFVLKKASPSCGLERVRVHGRPGGMPQHTGTGLFAQALRRRRAELPLEEEGRLHDAVLRERFIEAVFSRNRWRAMEANGLGRAKLVAFHQAHKMLLLAHDPSRYRQLGRIVGDLGRRSDEESFGRYAELFASAFERPATVARHVNVLEHLIGHLKDLITAAERSELSLTLQDYRAGIVPLVVPITLLRFAVVRHGVEYVGDQLYLDPHPRELKLRNDARFVVP